MVYLLNYFYPTLFPENLSRYCSSPYEHREHSALLQGCLETERVCLCVSLPFERQAVVLWEDVPKTPELLVPPAFFRESVPCFPCWLFAWMCVSTKNTELVPPASLCDCHRVVGFLGGDWGNFAIPLHWAKGRSSPIMCAYFNYQHCVNVVCVCACVRALVAGPWHTHITVCRVAPTQRPAPSLLVMTVLYLPPDVCF